MPIVRHDSIEKVEADRYTYVEEMVFRGLTDRRILIVFHPRLRKEIKSYIIKAREVESENQPKAEKEVCHLQ